MGLLTFFRKYSVKSLKSFVRGMHRKPNGSCVSTSGSKQNQAWNSLRRWNKPRYCCSRVAHCKSGWSISSCRLQIKRRKRKAHRDERQRCLHSDPDEIVGHEDRLAQVARDDRRRQARESVDRLRAERTA